MNCSTKISDSNEQEGRDGNALQGSSSSSGGSSGGGLYRPVTRDPQDGRRNEINTAADWPLPMQCPRRV